MTDDARKSDGQGRDARGPRQIPAQGWRDIVLRVKNDISSDALSLIAAGVAFYAFLSIFPAITALISIYGLVADPTQMAHQIDSLKGTVPPSALQLIQKQMMTIAQPSGSALGIGLLVSVLIAIYSASKGMSTLITALNVTYSEDEKRGFIQLTAMRLLLTLGGIVFVIVMLFIIGLPAYLNHTGLPGWLIIAIRVARWLLMLGLMMVGLAFVYALAPSRRRAEIRWSSPGVLFATGAWLIASIAFSFYIGHFSSYNKTYGSAAAIVILMTWFWLSVFLVLIGAEINAELEGQTRHDTTIGRRRPLGNRGATAADEVRRSP